VKDRITEACLPPVHQNMGCDPKHGEIGIFFQTWLKEVQPDIVVTINTHYS
jgi:hypothetical protein